MVAVDSLPFNVSEDLYKSIIEAEEAELEVACEALAARLGEELRAAKSRLGCGEVLLPRDLLPSVAREVLAQSEKEPCGLRGCTLDIQLETEEGGRVEISSVKWDPATSSTFQLTLRLRQDAGHKWRLSRLLQTLTKGRTVVIGSRFRLTKTRLYRPLSHSQ